MNNPINNFNNKSFPKGCITQYDRENPNLYKITQSHSGWDIIPNDGTGYGAPLYSMYDCVVVEVNNEATSGYGNAVRTMRSDGLINIYGHLSKVSVAVGDELKEGQVIGEMGNSGFVVSGQTVFWEANPFAGTHLHVTFIPTCIAGQGQGPVYNYQGKTFQYKHYNNGNLGSVNPSPYFADMESFEYTPKHIKRGDTGDAVKNLQTILFMEGLMEKEDIVGIYGPKTQAAVFEFQLRYNIVSKSNTYKGFYCGPKTVSQLKALYQQGITNP